MHLGNLRQQEETTGPAGAGEPLDVTLALALSRLPLCINEIWCLNR